VIFNITVVSGICSAKNRRISSRNSGDGERVGLAVGGCTVNDSGGVGDTSSGLETQTQGQGAGPGNHKGVEVHSKLKKSVNFDFEFQTSF